MYWNILIDKITTSTNVIFLSLKAGHRIEFRCNPGYQLKGEKIITCLNNGTWNFKSPSCIPMGCPPPKT